MNLFKKNRISKGLSVFIQLYLLMVVGFYLLDAYVDHQLKNRDTNTLYRDCHKIWATRGLVLEGDRSLTSSGNSINTIKLAFQQGAKGSEIDLFYDVEMNRYILSHNYPYRLKDGKLLTLEALINAIGDEYYLWLDLKKLGHLNQQEVQAATTRLNEITLNKSIRKKIYIEGEDPINLSYFRDAKFRTIFDTQPLKSSNWLSDFVLTLYKMIYYFNDFSVMGMNSGDKDDLIYDDEAEQILENVPLFLYHVPDKTELLQRLSKIKNIRVILDTNHSANRFHLNSCHTSESLL